VNAMNTNRKPYLSKRVRAGIRSLAERVNARTIEEAIALAWMDRMATIAEPEAQDAQSPRIGAGSGNAPGLEGDGRETT